MTEMHGKFPCILTKLQPAKRWEGVTKPLNFYSTKIYNYDLLTTYHTFNG
jgi:hypothetical protein